MSWFKSFGPSFFMFPGLSLDCSCQDATAGEAAGGGQEEHQSTKKWGFTATQLQGCLWKLQQCTQHITVDAWTWQQSFNSIILNWDGKDNDKNVKTKNVTKIYEVPIEEKAPVQWLLVTKVSRVHGHDYHFLWGHQSTCAISTTALPPHISNLTIRSSGKARAQRRTSNRNLTWKCRQAGALLRQNRKSLGAKLQLVGSKLMSLMWAKGDSGILQTRGKKRMKSQTHQSKSTHITTVTTVTTIVSTSKSKSQVTEAQSHGLSISQTSALGTSHPQQSAIQFFTGPSRQSEILHGSPQDFASRVLNVSNGLMFPNQMMLVDREFVRWRL